MPKAFLVKKKVEKFKRLPSNLILARPRIGECNNVLYLFDALVITPDRYRAHKNFFMYFDQINPLTISVIYACIAW